jgi:hypothetical protein
MDDKKAVIEQIYKAFSNNEYPGDDYLQGSFEGYEPYAEIEPFKGRTDWKTSPQSCSTPSLEHSTFSLKRG